MRPEERQEGLDVRLDER
jgi:hypothetical protein